MTEKNRMILKWVKIGIICGILSDLCYGLAISVPMPDKVSTVVFAALGPLLIAGAPGSYHFIKQHRNSIALQIGTLFMILAGLSMTFMAVVQRSVVMTFNPIKPDMADTVAYKAWKMAFVSGDAVQLGMDIVWDIFILIATILIAVSIFSHPRLGKILSVSGVVIGLAGLYLNFSTFPTPPGQGGSFDIGPVVGTWFLVVMIFIIFNFKWLRGKLEEAV